MFVGKLITFPRRPDTAVALFQLGDRVTARDVPQYFAQNRLPANLAFCHDRYAFRDVVRSAQTERTTSAFTCSITINVKPMIENLLQGNIIFGHYVCHEFSN